MTKLCPHIQILNDATLAAIGRVKPPIVKVMDPSRETLTLESEITDVLELVSTVTTVMTLESVVP